MACPSSAPSPKAIDLAEDREHFSALLRELGLKQAEAGTATNVEDAAAIAGRIGYPVLLRPSFVLGGRGMIIVYEEKELRQYMSEAVEASEERPVLIDRFLENAVEIDVDVIADRERAVIGAIMQHVEPAGIHSGDSASMIPAMGISMKMHKEITRASKELARRLNVCGLMNIQFAVKDEQLYVIEVNPRASRTVPFVSKAIGKPLAKMAAPDHGRQNAGGTGLHPGNHAGIPLREGSRLPVGPLPGHRRGAGAGNEIHRGSHGH